MDEMWRRLRSRRAVQWIVAYLAGAWVVVQVIHLLGEQFGVSITVLRSVTAILAVGVLAALVLAWYHGEKGTQRATGPELLMLAGILVIAGSSVALVRNAPSQVAARDEKVTTTLSAGLESFPVARDKSIAVLPFANLSEERGNEHFSDGLTEELLMDLARMTNLRVISRTSVMRYKDGDRTLREIGDELGVAHVVAGSVRRDGDRVRITAQLIDARTDEHVWANSYDSDLSDIFAIQRTIASQIVGSLRAALPALNGVDRGAVAPTQNGQAYQRYLEGKYLFHERFGEGGTDRLLRSAALLQEAVEADPLFSRAWGALSLTYAHLSVVTTSSLTPAEASARAQAAVAQALGIDSAVADAYVARGMLHARRLRWRDAEKSFLQALAAEPQNAPAHDWYGTLLVSVGRSQEAERILRRSAELDPINARTLHWLADALRNSGRLDESRLHAQRSVDLGLFSSSIGVYIGHIQRQEWEEAIRYQEATSRKWGIDPAYVRPLVSAVRDSALITRSMAAAAAVGARESRIGGLLYAFYFDFAIPEPALDAMENMVEDGSGLYSLWRVWEPQFTEIRNHTRFQHLATRIGLVDYWREWGWPDLCRAAGDGFTCR
jgi:TolB-like protein/tetratricopeptide (TPR) repeat protein